MKVLRIVERIVFLVAVVLGVAALGFSLMLDEQAAEPAVGMASSVLPIFVLGSGSLLVLLLVGAFLRYSKNDAAWRVGEGLLIVSFVTLLGVALATLAVSDMPGLTVILALVAGIIYAADAIVRFIIFIVRIVRPECASQNPDTDERIQNVLKWKKLADDGIITKEEYEEKRVKILGLDK